MKKIIKKSEAELIRKVNNFDAESFATCINWLNKGKTEMLLNKELDAIVIYLVTREIMATSFTGMTSNAGEICSDINHTLNCSLGYTRNLVICETNKCDRKLIADINMITITENNPYVKPLQSKL